MPKPTVFQLLDYQPQTKEVWQFHWSQARLRMPIAPARTSKSYSTAKDVVAEIVPDIRFDKAGNVTPQEKSKLVWIVGTDYSNNKEFEYVYTDLVESHRKHKLPYRVTTKHFSKAQGNLEIILEWGDKRNPDGDICRTIIQGKSIRNPESLQGEEVDIWVQSEAADQPANVWTKYGDTRAGMAIFPTTPKLKAKWLKDLFDRSQGYSHTKECVERCAPYCPIISSGLESFVFTPEANPTYNWKRYWQAHALAEARVLGGKAITRPTGHDCFDPHTYCIAMEDPEFGEQFGGRWTGQSERVLPWSEIGNSSNVMTEVPLWWENSTYYIGFDYGYNDPCAVNWYAVSPHGDVLLYREIYQRKLRVDEVIRKTVQATEVYKERISGWIPDPQKPEVESYLRELGLPVFVTNRGQMRDRKSGFMRLINLLGPDPVTGQPKFFIMAEGKEKGFGAPNAIQEFANLRRKPGEFDEFSTGAITGADHSVDNARYFVQSRPRMPHDYHDINREFDKHAAWVLRNRKQHIPPPLVGRYPGLVR